MKYSLSLLFALSLTFCAHAQDSTLTVKKDTVQASFPGGAPGWQQYLQKNLRAEVSENIKLKRRQKDSTEVIRLSFLVDTDGNVSDVKVDTQTPVTPEVATEAKRVIAQGPKWVPATINGQKVIYRQKQTISFVVSIAR